MDITSGDLVNLMKKQTLTRSTGGRDVGSQLQTNSVSVSVGVQEYVIYSCP